MRAWYLGNMAMGLLYTCSLGDIQADAPVALVQNRRQNGADVMEVVPMDHQLPGQREQAWPRLHPSAHHIHLASMLLNLQCCCPQRQSPIGIPALRSSST